MSSVPIYILIGHTFIINNNGGPNTLSTIKNASQIPIITHNSLNLSSLVLQYGITETASETNTPFLPSTTRIPTVDESLISATSAPNYESVEAVLSTTPDAPIATQIEDCEIRRDDYTYVPGFSAYKLHNQASNWSMARLSCEEECGHLAVINSAAEANAIIQIFKNATPVIGSSYPNHVIIGFHDLDHEGEFKTIHGQSLPEAGYDSWNSMDPDGGAGQNCGCIDRKALLYDTWCDRPHGFICEIPMRQKVGPALEAN